MNNVGINMLEEASKPQWEWDRKLLKKELLLASMYFCIFAYLYICMQVFPCYNICVVFKMSC